MVPLFQAFLTKIWWGDMAASTPVLRLLGAFLCPGLLYTGLIAFRCVGSGGWRSHWGRGSWSSIHAGPPRPPARLPRAPTFPEGALCLQRGGPTADGPGGPAGAGQPGHGEEPAQRPGQRVRAWRAGAQTLGGSVSRGPWPCFTAVTPLRSRLGEPAEARRTQGRRDPRAAFLPTRWRQFWGAPVTVFLGNVVMYFAFLFLFTYVLLVDFRPPPQGPSGPEAALYFWVFTLVLEEVRQVSGGPVPAAEAGSRLQSPEPRPEGAACREGPVCPPPGLLHRRGHAAGEQAHALPGGQLEQV